MPYGEIRVDTITFTNAGVDKSITVSGLFASTSGNLTVTGTISGTTFTGTTASFTSGNVTTFSGGTCTITSGVFASGTATNPSISFIADSNTGLYSPGADQVAISTSGTGRLFVNSSGNVGIGTSAPQANLQVLDSIKVSNSSQSQGNVILGDGGSTAFNVGIARWNGATNAAGAGGLGYFSQGTSNLGGHYFYTGDAVAGSQTERLRIDSSGRVGIGTSNPGCKVDILAESNTSLSPTIRVNSNNVAVNTALAYDGLICNSQLTIGNTTTNPLIFNTNSTERLRIDSSGNVGIGTTTPNVTGFGGTVATINIATGSNGGLELTKNNVAAGHFTVESASSNDIRIGAVGGSAALTFQTGGTERSRIDSAGRLLVGQTTTGLQAARSFSWQGSGEGTLYISHSSSDGNGDPFVKFGYNAGQIGSIIQAGNTGIGVYSNDYLALGSNNTERLRINSSGNVGIGTTNPITLLQVGAGNTSPNTAKALINTGDAAISGLIISNWTGSATTNGPRIGFDNSSVGSFSIGGGNGTHSFVVRDDQTASDRLTIDSAGRLLVGTSTYDGNARAVIQGNTSSNTTGALVVRYNGTRPASAGEGIGSIRFESTSQTNANYHYASISCDTDGASSSDTDIPGRLVFSTTADGASSPTTRFTLNRVGDSVFSNTSAVYPTTDNAATIGGSSNRWSAVWAANGTIQTSDQRAKTEITAAQLGSNFIKALRPVSYKWIDGGQIDSGRRDEDNNYIYESVPGTRTHWGFIAQEVKEAVDAAGVDFGGWVLTDKDDPDSQQALRYDQFIAPLTKALQEALVEIDVLKAKVAALEAS